MKFRNLFLAGAVAAVLGISATGCNENPTDPPGGGGPGNPTGLMASTQGPTSVALKWSAVTGATSYTVSWKATGSGDSGSTPGVTGTTYTVTNLTKGQRYTFTVRGVNADGASTGATIDWAAADRFTSDVNGPATINIYEKSSTKGSAIDISAAGAANVSVVAGSPGKAMLAFYRYNDSLIVGPAYAITEYKTSANNDFTKVDSSTYISTNAFDVTSLNDWFSDKSIDEYIQNSGASAGNVIAFNFSPSETKSKGFYMRTGAAGNYRYARVLIMNNGGKILQGSGSEEFITVQISYQSTPNLPFAKPAGFSPAAVVATATAGH